MTLEHILISGYFPKYPTLKELTLDAFAGSTATEVNIYIDITDMVSKLYRPDVRIEKPLSITATVLNLCAHLRTYYRQYHQVETTFFLVFSDMRSNTYNCNLVPNYNKKHIDKMEANVSHTDAVIMAMKMLLILCPHLPGIYFKYDIYEASVVIYDLILRAEAGGNINPNIVITKEPLAYQLPAMHKNTVIFIDDKKNERFSVIKTQTALQLYLIDTGRTAIFNNTKIIDKVCAINPELLGVFITLTNLPSRSIGSIMSINRAINTLYGLIDKGILENSYIFNTEYLYNSIFNGLSTVSLEMFTLRFNAIDLVAQHMYYMNTPMCGNINMEDIDDPEGVQTINNTYFKDTPIDLNRL